MPVEATAAGELAGITIVVSSLRHCMLLILLIIPLFGGWHLIPHGRRTEEVISELNCVSPCQRFTRDVATVGA